MSSSGDQYCIRCGQPSHGSTCAFCGVSVDDDERETRYIPRTPGPTAGAAGAGAGWGASQWQGSQGQGYAANGGGQAPPPPPSGGAAYGSGPGQSQRGQGGNRTPLFIALGLVVALLAGIVIFLATRGGDEKQEASAPPTYGAEGEGRPGNNGLVPGGESTGEAPEGGQPTVESSTPAPPPATSEPAPSPSTSAGQSQGSSNDGGNDTGGDGGNQGSGNDQGAGAPDVPDLAGSRTFRRGGWR